VDILGTEWRIAGGSSTRGNANREDEGEGRLSSPPTPTSTSIRELRGPPKYPSTILSSLSLKPFLASSTSREEGRAEIEEPWD